MILETFQPGYMDSLGLGYRDLKEDNPRLIMCSLTRFGQTGPGRTLRQRPDTPGSRRPDGLLRLQRRDVDDPPPIAGGGGQAWHMGCHYAYMGSWPR